MKAKVLCLADGCDDVAIPHSVYCEDHKLGPKFSCSTPGCKNEGFYMRVISSVSHDVSAFGDVAEEENKNSYEGEGERPVMCASCEEPAKDLLPGEPLNW